MRGLAPAQVGVLAVLAVATGSLTWLLPENFGHGIVLAGAWGFLAVAAWRTALILLSAASPAPPPEPLVWPRYTVLAALHDEAEVVGQLIDRLSRIDYPADRLQGLLVLEAQDHGTIAAALATPRPDWLDVLGVPPGRPQTKPRALNYALAHATGELLTVYDAEDEPDPLQVREAASRFAVDTQGQLACLQAPLRIRRRDRANGSPFLDRQFAAEYASLFETALPGIARLGLAPIAFAYFHPLSDPVMEPQQSAVVQNPPLRVEADTVLRFGMIEGDGRERTVAGVWEVGPPQRLPPRIILVASASNAWNSRNSASQSARSASQRIERFILNAPPSSYNSRHETAGCAGSVGKVATN